MMQESREVLLGLKNELLLNNTVITEYNKLKAVEACETFNTNQATGKITSIYIHTSMVFHTSNLN